MSVDLEVHHFTYGPLTPVLAYALSVLGSFLGLYFTTRALEAEEQKERIWWLAGGSVALGGTAIWVMHFIGMLGFSVSGASLAYEVPLTLFSALLAVVFVGAGLFLVGFGMPVLLGGILAGSGVIAMHYTGMAAMNVGAETSYDPVLVGVSVVIALVAATAALYFGTKVKGWLSTLGAALVMGLAVSGMHYTGMFALNVHALEAGPVDGVDPVHLLVPLTGVVSVVTAILCGFVGGSGRNRRDDAGFQRPPEREPGVGY